MTLTLTPEQKAEGWRLHDGSVVCPIKDDLTRHGVKFKDGMNIQSDTHAKKWRWENVIAYRIIEAHGADAEPARPTPYPSGYDDLVFTDAGWSQTIIVDGKRPEWLRDDDGISAIIRTDGYSGHWNESWQWELAIRVRRREPKRETVECRLLFTNGSPFNDHCNGTIDLIDGKPDVSTLKIGGEA